MTNPRKNQESIEDQLAEFTDRILADDSTEQDEATFAPNPDLHTLQKTALRLKAAFEGSEPDQADIRRMYRNIRKRGNLPEHKSSKTLWQIIAGMFSPTKKGWTSQQSRKRLSVAASLVTLAILLLVAIPFLHTTDTNLPGASGQNPSTYVLLVLGGLILLAVWLFRRKP